MYPYFSQLTPNVTKKLFLPMLLDQDHHYGYSLTVESPQNSCKLLNKGWFTFRPQSLKL